MHRKEKIRWRGIYFDLWMYRIQYYRYSERLQYFTEDLEYDLGKNLDIDVLNSDCYEGGSNLQDAKVIRGRYPVVINC